MTAHHHVFLERLGELQGDMRDAAFARQLSIPPSTLQRYRAGSFPSIEIAAKIAEAFNVSLDWLIGRPGASRDASSLLNVRYLGEAISILEEWLAQNDRTMNAKKKADVVTQLYHFIVDDASAGDGPLSKKMAQRILRLVA